MKNWWDLLDSIGQFDLDVIWHHRSHASRTSLIHLTALTPDLASRCSLVVPEYGKEKKFTDKLPQCNVHIVEQDRSSERSLYRLPSFQPRIDVILHHGARIGVKEQNHRLEILFRRYQEADRLTVGLPPVLRSRSSVL